MSNQPAKTTRAAAPSKGAAARAEVTLDAKKITWRDLDLQLPQQLPPTILFDVTEIEAAGNDPLPVFRLLRSVLGSGQFTDVRNKIEDDDDLIAVVDGLLGDILGQYGISLGE